MYLPKIFKSEDLKLAKEIISENSFSSLIVSSEKILSTKAMILVNQDEKDDFYLETHLSRANPVAKILANDLEVLCDFIGANTYISSSWYDHINVSTWNYEAVQVYGKVQLMSDDEFYVHLKRLTEKFESPQKCPMTIDKMGDKYVGQEMKGAVGFNILPSEINVKQKLSQNRNTKNKERIVQALNKSGLEHDSVMAKKIKL